MQARSREIGLNKFHDNFNGLSDSTFLQLLRFCVNYIIRLNCTVIWPEHQREATNNGDQVTPTLLTCLILRRLATGCR